MVRKNFIDVKEFFSGRAPLYHRVSRWAVSEEVNRASERQLEGIGGGLAVDVGAGTGVLIGRVRGFSARIALDISAEMLRLAEDPSVTKVLGNLHQLPFRSEGVDLALCRQVLHYCDVNVAVGELARVVAPAGAIHIAQVVEVPNVPESWDREWAGFRGVRDRRHLRVAELESACGGCGLQILRFEDLIVRDSYRWREFFLKHNVCGAMEADVVAFFSDTPESIAREIELSLDDEGIAYNRRWAFWLLKRSNGS